MSGVELFSCPVLFRTCPDSFRVILFSCPPPFRGDNRTGQQDREQRCGLAFFGLPCPRFNITITRGYGLAELPVACVSDPRLPPGIVVALLLVACPANVEGEQILSLLVSNEEHQTLIPSFANHPSLE